MGEREREREDITGGAEEVDLNSTQ
jgi:hypothetical protein